MKQLLIITIAILLFTSCNKDKTPPTPAPKVVLLKKTTIKDASSNTKSITENFYNSNNAMTGRTIYDASSNKTSNYVCETNAAKQLTKFWETTGANTDVLLYTYDANGRLLKQENYNSSSTGVPTTLRIWQEFTYSTTGYEYQTFNTTSSNSVSRGVYTYSADGKNIVDNKLYSGTALFGSYTSGNFDDKNNPAAATAAPFDVRYSRNNRITGTATPANTGVTTNYTYTYTYDANNFPVTVTEKANGVVNSTTEYEYLVK